MKKPSRRLPFDLAEELPGLRRWRNHPVERERDVHGTRALWRALLAIVVAAAPAGIYLMQQNECLKLTYAVSELRASERALAEEERRLIGVRSELGSLATIETWANRNGLVKPEPDDVVVVRDADARRRPEAIADAGVGVQRTRD